jgi:adenylate cyclase
MNMQPRHERLDWDPAPVVSWLLEEGRFLPSLRDTLGELGSRLQDQGAPLWRLRLALRTVHPLVTAISAVWERDAGLMQYNEAPHGLESRAAFLGSPMERIQKTGMPFRRMLAGPMGPEEHEVLHELKARGASDYLGLPLRYSDGGRGILIFVTDLALGFSDSDLDHFGRIADAFAPIVEIFRLRHLSEAVSAAYLGPRTAERVLAGQITLGHIDTIEAAVMVSDLRGYTAMSAALPPAETLRRVNAYFELLDIAIGENGGEILKFMGDGVLAIFPTGPGTDGRAACDQALTAAMSALDAAEALDAGWEMTFGMGLHYGQVLYGNVGSTGRLDFTVMGQAVNIAARLEPLCGLHDWPIICSEAFALRVDAVPRPLAQAALKGLAAPIDVFGL